MDSDLTLLNHHNESLRLSRLPLYQNQDKIAIISKEGGEFLVSKFVFNFLSVYSSADTDIIFTPVSTKSLSLICQALSFKRFEDISLEDLNLLGINSNYFSADQSLKEENNISEEVESKFTNSSISLLENQLSKDVLVQRTRDKLESKLLNVDKVAAVDSLMPNDVGLSVLESTIEDMTNMKESNLQDEQALIEFTPEGLNDKIASNETDSSNTVVSLLNKNGKAMKERRPRQKIVGDPVLKWKTIDGKEVLESMMCQICGNVFERTDFSSKGRRDLNQRHFRHFERHRKQTQACECGIQFNSLAEKKRHFQDIHKSFIKCPKCAQFLANKENLEQHLINKHTVRECDSCEYITEDKRELRRHKTIHDPKEQETHEEKKEVKIHECTEAECGKTFTNLDKLKSHQRKCIKVECPECHKRVSMDYLNKHITNAHQNNEKKYCCDQCGKAFVDKFRMEQHEQVEHKGHRFKCRYPECDKSDQEYRDQSNRLAHERRKHGATYTKFLDAKVTSYFT